MCYLVLVAPSGECVRGEDRVRLFGWLAPFVFAYLPVLNLVVVCNWLHLACVSIMLICIIMYFCPACQLVVLRSRLTTIAIKSIIIITPF